MNPIPTTEDRIWTVISHLSVLAFGMGIALPIVGWSDQRRKSSYASFQCLQALGYQSLGFTVWALSSLILVIIAAAILLDSLQAQGGNSLNADPAVRPGIVVIFVIIFGLFGLYSLLPIFGAVACILGRDFRYPILGDRLARYLAYDPRVKSEELKWLDEDHEFRWVAAMGHFSILILFWGMLAPLTAWILQGSRSRFLRFQSIQTLFYQTVTTVLYLVALLFYFLGFAFLIASLETLGTSNLNSSIGIFGMVIFGISLLISFGLILLIPLLHILGQWAGVRVLKGDNYSYPWVGRLVDKWITKNSAREEKLT